MRDTKNCNRCGELVEIVPAGKSKKPPYKEYGSFAKCKKCGNSEQIGSQPVQYQQNRQPQGWNPPNAPEVANYANTPNLGFLAGQLNKLADRVAKLEDILLGPKQEVKVQDLPVYEFPIDKVNDEIRKEDIPF